MTPINIKRSGDAKFINSVAPSHRGDILFFLLSRGDDLGQKNTLSDHYLRIPYSSDTPRHHTMESMKSIVTPPFPINYEYHHTHAFYQIRVSQMGTVG